MLARDRSFGSDSPIRDYWLTRCEGFTVRSGRRRLGVVSEVECGASAPRAEMLVVQRRRRRTLMLPATQVVAVVPSQDLLLARRRASRTRPAVTATGRGARLALRGVAAAGRAARRGLAVATPVVLRFLSLAATVAWYIVVTLARRLRHDGVLFARWVARELSARNRALQERTDGRPIHFAVARISRRPS
jgi:hypothetical protein